MAADVVALAQLALHQARVGLHVLADDEEGGAGVLGLQDVQDLRRPAWIGPIVEGQGDELLRTGAVALDHIGCRHHLVVLFRDQLGVGIGGQGPPAGGGPGDDVQHLARSVEVDVLGRGQDGQVVQAGLAIGMGQHLPDARVLRPQPPQGIPARAVVVRDLHLVEQRRRVQEPYVVVQAGVVLVAERRVQARAVHADIAFGVMGELGRLVEGDDLGVGRVGLVSLLPVVAIAAESHDGLGFIKPGQPLVEIGLEPVLSGHRARIAGRPMLVERHEHQRVAGGLQLFQRRGIVAVEGGDPDLAP